MPRSPIRAAPRGDAIRCRFEKRQELERVTVDCTHGRIETRKIWTPSALNEYLDFPHVGQAFVIERDTIEKKTGKRSQEIAYGITRRPETQADADVSWRSTAATGPSRTAATTS